LVTAKNKSGETALHEAAAKGNIDAIELLLNNNAPIEAPDNDGDTPLINAAKNGRTKAILALLARGANIDSRNNNGETALLIAAKLDKPTALKLLLKKGADAKTATAANDTLLSLATENEQLDIIAFLLNSPALVNLASIIQEAHYRNKKKVQFFLANWENDKNETLLISCVNNRDIPSLRSLIEWGANPYQGDATGQNAFDYAQQLQNQDPEKQIIIDILHKTTHPAPTEHDIEQQSQMKQTIERMQQLHTSMQPKTKTRSPFLCCRCRPGRRNKKKRLKQRHL